MTDDRFLRLPEVKAKTGLGSTTIYKMAGSGAFPKQCRLGPRCVAWRQSEIEAWIAQQQSVSEASPAR